jgi:hypothetical protein
MNDLQSKSGRWSGFWIQNDIRATMRLQLQFTPASVAGGGRDFVGGFVIHGVTSPAGGVQFAKRYSTHLVYYQGTWDGTLIAGRWTMLQPDEDFVDEGEFEIWPDGEEMGLEFLEREVALTG